MGMNFKTGSFTIPSGQGTGNYAVTGVGLGAAGKAIRFVANRAPAVGFVDEANDSEGCATSAAQQWSCATLSSDNAGVLDAAKTMNIDRCITLFPSGQTATLDFQAAFVSFDGADGNFTINITNAANAPAQDLIIIYFIWGGSDITDVKAGNFALTAGAGPSATTDPGFRPEAVWMASARCTLAQLGTLIGGHQLFLGTATAVGEEGASGIAAVGMRQRVDRCLVLHDNANGESGQLHLASFDATGFTMAHDANPTQADMVGYLAFAGGRWKAVNDLQKTSTGLLAKSGIGFQPIGMMSVSLGNTATTAIVAASPALRMSRGGSDGTNERADWLGDPVGVTPTQTADHYSNTKHIGHRTPAAVVGSMTTEAEADISTFDSDGYTRDWTIADATARQDWSLVFAADVALTGTANLPRRLGRGAGW